MTGQYIEKDMNQVITWGKALAHWRQLWTCLNKKATISIKEPDDLQSEVEELEIEQEEG